MGEHIMSDVTEINAETGEVVVRAYTAEEIQHRDAMQKPEELALQEEQIATYLSIKQSAIAKLTSLGLTEEEARAIAGL
jgi:hypothetical protein